MVTGALKLQINLQNVMGTIHMIHALSLLKSYNSFVDQTDI